MIVVDASVAVKWVLPEDFSDAARALTFTADMAAPSFWLLESASVLWKRHRRGEFSAAGARDLLERLRSISVRNHDQPEDAAAALALASAIPHSVYDCLYLVHAMRLDALLVTADDQFIRALAPHPHLADRVRHVKDYKPE